MTAKDWKKLIIKGMKEVGTYQKTFDAAVNTLSDTLEQRDKVFDQYVQEGALPMVLKTTDRGAENMVKNPLLSLWMELNRDALALWRDCGLTPAGLRKINEGAVKQVKKASALETALAKMA